MEDIMKQFTGLLTTFAAVSLCACGATTGGVAGTMAQQAAMQTISSPTPTPAAQPAIVNGDADCTSLSAQLAEVNALINQSNQTIAASGGVNVAGKVAATGASHVALHNGAAGALAKVPFGGLFAKAAVDSVANAGKRKAAKAQADLQNATLRKATLTGLYAGKNCAS